MVSKKSESREKPSVLAFEKKLVPSDGRLYGCRWEEKEKVRPLSLVEKSVRGTISNRLSSKIANDPAKLNAEVEKANLQIVDACFLNNEQDTLKLNFTLKVLGGIEKPSACNSCSFAQKYVSATSNYDFKVLAKRYALNIANGRYLWRNRLGAEKICVKVVDNISGKKWDFDDAYKYSIRNFTEIDSDVENLSAEIASALSNENKYLLLDIECFAKVGKAQEVYPSEELVFNKRKDDKSKILYAVDGVAAMHSQKIGNAIRTIDTWYPDYSDSVGPIAIEPYGSVTNLGKAYRGPADKKDFYTLFDKFVLEPDVNIADDEKHYIMAILVRGGVFGEAEKGKKEE